MSDELIAHRRKDGTTQSIQEHLYGTSRLAGEFAKEINLEATGNVLGLLHDLGKASQQFQNYILSAEGLINPDSDNFLDPIANKGKIDHSTAGAQIIYQYFWGQDKKKNIAAQIIALCIASHHSGLFDCLTPEGEDNFQKRMKKEAEKTHIIDASSYLEVIRQKLNSYLEKNIEQEIFIKLKEIKEENESQDTLIFKYGLLIRYLLSCLIDADRLDTADFETPNNNSIRNYGKYVSWESLIQLLNIKINEFEKRNNKNEVDQLRCQISQACYDFSFKPKGIYQLTVPTGGGKTFSSLRFALQHAANHGMHRIIFVIPYTSIIDQNADEVRKILETKDKNGHFSGDIVLEHHSNLTPEEESYKQSLLSQDWDAPVVFTTQVQFLEALFGSGTRGARRMHQLANSVIVLDEIQTMPVNCIHMLNIALRFLVHACGSTVVLCTATQPPLDRIDATYRALTIHSDQRIIANEKELFEKLKRVEVFDGRKIGGWSNSEVADLAEKLLKEMGSVLIVVNTKKSARALYQEIEKLHIATIYHLSTAMCPAHRLNVLTEVKEKLDHEPVICISTQLIEAGVDIDFGSTIRYLAGLDSITQASGRCNRNGKRDGLGIVWIVNPEEENIDRLETIKIGQEKAQRVLDEYKNDPQAFNHSPISIEAMAHYYNYYFYERRDEMRYRIGSKSPAGRNDDIFNLLSLNTLSVDGYRRQNQQREPDIPFRQSFMTAAKSFTVIDSPTRGVVVPYQYDGEQLILDLCSTSELRKQFRLIKKAQRYSVNLFLHEFKKLADIGAIQEVQPETGIFYLDSQFYSDQFGWSDEPVNQMKTLIS